MATSARLEELQQKFNENPRRYFAPLANEHRKLGDLDQAIALCRTHLPQQPQHVSGHIVLAQALFEAGEISDARGAFELALDLDPENLIALRFLGDIARAQGEHPTARQWYERVLDADPRNEEIAQLVRDLERAGPVPVAQATVVQESVPEAPETSGEPNEEAVDAFAVTETIQDAPAPIEDLATAWQHEVAALDSAPAAAAEFDASDSFAAPAEPDSDYSRDELTATTEQQHVANPTAEFSAETEPVEALMSERTPEPEAIASWTPEDSSEREMAIELPPMETASVSAADSEPRTEPNEPWAEPDEEFVATVPPVTPAPPDTPPPFAEIDYSMFEAVADEEAMAVATPVQPISAVPPADVRDAAPATPDDWFSTASAPPADIESVASHGPDETAFDLDAAFQSVLPNNHEPVAEPQSAASLELPQDTLPELADLKSDEWTSEDAPAAMPDEAAFTTSSLDGGDNVDAAFAELDRMTASLESDIAGSAMLLPDEQYAAPIGEVATPTHVDALIGRTPESGAPAVEETPSAFVTETMAELYLQQGFRDEALAVYRQLLTMHPDDAVLAERIRALEGGVADTAPSFTSETAARDTGDATYRATPAHADAAGQSVRAFLGVFARRRAPMRRRERASEQPAAVPQVESGLSALFGTPQSADVGSAAVLAGAFAEPNGATEALPGRPTRAAEEELSLGDVFASGNASSPRSSTFDEFFSTGSANPPAQSPLDEEGSDMVQFTAWLEGLKKK